MPPLVPLPECSRATIARHANEIQKMLFKGNRYRYTLANIVTLLNQLSGVEYAPHSNIKWGYALLAVIALESTFKQMGVGGTDKQQQVKQCMAGGMLYMEGDKIVNKKLMDEILPHEDIHARNDWINKCVKRRKIFELFDEPEFFADNGQTYGGPSCVSSVHLHVVMFCPNSESNRDTRGINTKYYTVLDCNKHSQSITTGYSVCEGS